MTADGDDQRKFHVVLHRIYNQRQLDLEQDNVEHQKKVLPKVVKECVTTVPSKYKLHSQETHIFGFSHSHHAMGGSALYTVY